MHIDIGTEETELAFAYSVIHQTLNTCAKALEQGIILTPDVLRHAKFSFKSENDRNVMQITFPEVVYDADLDDWRLFDFHSREEK